MTERLTLSDATVRRLAQLEEESFGGEAWNEAQIREEFLYSAHFFGEVQNGEIVGYVCFTVVCGELQIGTLVVDKNHRGRGVAYTLLSDVLNAFVGKYDVAVLEVNVENAAAIALYEKCGFQKAGVRKNFYGRTNFSSRDAYTMIKKSDV